MLLSQNRKISIGYTDVCCKFRGLCLPKRLCLRVSHPKCNGPDSALRTTATSLGYPKGGRTSGLEVSTVSFAENMGAPRVVLPGTRSNARS